MTSIQTLPADVVHRMAAGEVIDSLASVVRELVENALDAGATRISVCLWPEQWRVRVSDNGQGMRLEDLQQAALPHSTSKIHTGDDLFRIQSLGFRGEALHSLAQLAELEIGSRHQASPDGWWVSYDAQGNPQREKPGAIAPGTIVTAADLFGNWLARRQSLPSLPQQLRAIQLTIQSAALCHPEVTWQVQQNNREWFSIWAGESALKSLPQFLREVQPGDLREINFEGIDGLASTLLLGLPDRCHRYRPDWVKVAVNGRMVRFPELEQTLLNGFRRTLPRDRHPVCFLHLRLHPDAVDWNRHPAKAELYLKDLPTWQERVSQTIAHTLDLNAPTLPETLYTERVGQLLKTAEVGGSYGSRSIQPDDESVAFTAGSPGRLRAIAQLHGMYIVAEHPSGIRLIEQHIAHERVLYEKLCDRWQLVPLEPPVLLNGLTPTQLNQLQRLGIEVEPFGEQVWAVRTAPEPLSRREDCADALLELSLGGDLESALVATACRTAIRNGTPLTLPEMQTLLNQWQATRNPRTCPHGRPICLTLEESSLSRFFRRHWVIGKSHGI